MMLNRSVFFVLYWVVVSLAYAEEQTAADYLGKMRQAMHTLNYQGTVVFMENGVLDAVHYRHAVAKGREQEQLISLNSPAREIIREAGTVQCIFKETGKAVVDHRPLNHSFLIDFPQDIARLEQFYQFEIKGMETVAMRRCYRIDIMPRDDYRYAWRIWVDKDVFLPLKIELLDLTGKALEQVVFTDLSLPAAIPFISLNDTAEDKVRHIHRATNQTQATWPFILENIPPGFETQFYSETPIHKTSEYSVSHLLLSDGLSSVSVYLDKADDSLGDSQQGLGSVNSVTRILGDKLLVVLGKVPPKTVQFIAEGVVLK